MMDYGAADQTGIAFYGDDQEEDELQYEEENQPELYSGGGEDAEPPPPPICSADDIAASQELKHSVNDSSSSSAGKLFVGGIAWETSEESFSRYFSKYGEIVDSVIMMDKVSGRPRGFGFVTFVDAEVASKVLQEEHVIDGRVVEVKRTVPREDMPLRGVSKTKKIFIGGIPISLTEGGLKEYFSSYGNIVECQIMMDHKTGRPRGFGFVSFDNEDAVEKVLSDGRMHEVSGKQVEIKRAEPKRAGIDHPSESRMSRAGGSSLKPYGNFNNVAEEYGSGYGGKMSNGYGGFGSYGAYGHYMGNYGMSSAGFYGGYGGYGYGFGFGGAMYGAAGYGGDNYGAPGNYGGAKGYGSGVGIGYDGSESHGNVGNASGYGAPKGHGSGNGRGYGNNGAAAGAGRFHPYRK
ncbi:PREDICTED: heterogeneous nuclear ribonucleoprotein 1-like [Ipomoea nil]|uniref:heterogeneous nuclear ribonucleoprotein 1-like n=1 Tax=Ipomoea nil TaxID=35883 RepID=UPI000900EF62|nr:PREDICTED: heterogeneous nuclear ribonucleoprotein 1-like [Ipomoea nil]XP_019196237.1 PREDICTED: heterogeneous nuclear ribonucleoprotein 1-like [Ipomoea nil]XP_019196238.1 PREDICTED: heterogeneous nuclear ribonucleoprotein 1-like [Ipomoea nil]